MNRHHPITPEILELQRSVPNSRIEYDSESPGAVPYCTVDGKRQVISLPCATGYDLWVPRRKPRPGDDVTCSDFGVSLQQAIAFLYGAPLKQIRNEHPNTSSPS